MSRLHHWLGADLFAETGRPSSLLQDLLRANLSRTAISLADLELALVLAEVWATTPLIGSADGAAVACNLLRYRNGDVSPPVMADVDRALARLGEVSARESAPLIEKAGRLILAYRDARPAPPEGLEEADWFLLLLRFAELFKTISRRARLSPAVEPSSAAPALPPDDLIEGRLPPASAWPDDDSADLLWPQELEALRIDLDESTLNLDQCVASPVDPLAELSFLHPTAEEAALRLLRRFFTRLRSVPSGYSA